MKRSCLICKTCLGKIVMRLLNALTLTSLMPLISLSLACGRVFVIAYRIKLLRYFPKFFSQNLNTNDKCKDR